MKTTIEYPTLIGGTVTIHIIKPTMAMMTVVRDCIDVLELNDISIQIDVYDHIPHVFGDCRQRTQFGFVVRVMDNDDWVNTLLHELYHVYQMVNHKPLTESHADMFMTWYTDIPNTRWVNTNTGYRIVGMTQ